MCGIAGHVDFGKGANLDATKDLVAGIKHRGPDDQGLWVSHNGQCALGHARLSIIDLSPLGHQPMFDPETGNCIAFNGEIYNFGELRRQCEALGDHFRSQSDTEVILALYRRHGVDCLRFLRGMFAFAIWDARQDRLFFARDRVGKKPLNYALTKKGIVFCSEIHPLSRYPEVSRDMDTEALELYLQVQAIPAPWTIYSQIRKLPPAHFAVFDRSGLSITPYWTVNYLHTTEFSDGEALEAFEAKLTEAVKLRMISDVPLGALLSGGVDSSVVVALMAKLSATPVSTFSIGFREDSFNELPYADQVAKTCKTAHHPEIVEGDVAHLLPLLARHYGEPFADSSAIPSFHVSRVARRNVTVVLNGDGGDELLGGYSRYAVSDLSIRSGTALSGLLGARRMVNSLPLLARGRSIPARAIRKIARTVFPEIGSLSLFGAHWNDQDRARLMGRLHQPDLLPDWRYRWFEEAFRQAKNPIDRMLWVDNRTYLPDVLLPKMDIAGMHCGLEARSPFLDHELIELCATLPVRSKVHNHTGKYLLKRLAEKYFPPEFVHRRKMGFGIPVADWLRGPLREHTEAVILDPSIMEPLDLATIRRSWTTLTGGTSPTHSAESARIWTLLMYGQWRLLDRDGR